ncbi:MAG: hypothetical protein ACXWX1_03495 [Aeromicrobium sp.]
MSTGPILTWLLSGDVAVQYQVHRDLLGHEDRQLRQRIALEGDGAALLAARREDGHWGERFYQPKWTSTHYTLLELKNLGLPPDTPSPRETAKIILTQEMAPDGGIKPIGTARKSDDCINGMALNYLSYFGASGDDLVSIVDVLLARHMADGGFNCRFSTSGATHSSVHTTVSVLEGITEYLHQGHQHRRDELVGAAAASVEFLLRHRLYRSEHTGKPISPELVRLHHPARWHFDILRGLDALVSADVTYDHRMEDALGVLRNRRRSDGRWVANAAYPGETHIARTPAGQPNRWVTLMALRVLRRYDEAPGHDSPMATGAVELRS